MVLDISDAVERERGREREREREREGEMGRSIILTTLYHMKRQLYLYDGRGSTIDDVRRESSERTALHAHQGKPLAQR